VTESAGGGWFDSLKKLGAAGAEHMKKQITKEVKDLQQAGKTLKAAASDLGEVARGEKDMGQFVETYKPKLQGCIRRELGPRWCRLIYDDNAVLPALDTAHAFIPPPLPWFVKKEAFVQFCLEHRDTILGERALRIDALRADIGALCEPPAERQALAARLAESHGVSLTDARVGPEVDLAVRYVRSIPDILEATAAAATASERYDALFPVLSELEFHFLEGEEDPPASLVELLETSYLSLALVQMLSDKSLEQALPPLIDVDLGPANARMARVIGPAAKDLDAKVEAIIKDSEFMERAGKVVGQAIPVIAVAAVIAAAASAITGAGGDMGGDGGGYDGGGGGGGEGSIVSSTPTDRVLSGAYTNALFGSECAGSNWI
jgi:hypothetical protein